jgi:hypothetical protein
VNRMTQWIQTLGVLCIKENYLRHHTIKTYKNTDVMPYTLSFHLRIDSLWELSYSGVHSANIIKCPRLCLWEFAVGQQRKWKNTVQKIRCSVWKALDLKCGLLDNHILSPTYLLRILTLYDSILDLRLKCLIWGDSTECHLLFEIIFIHICFSV